MKILFIIHQFYPAYYTGTERYLFNLATVLKKLGHSIHVLTYDPTLTEDTSTRSTTTAIIQEYVYENISVTAIRARQEDPLMNFNAKQPSIQDDLHSIVTDYNPDIIHFAHAMRLTSVFEVAEKAKIPVVLTLTDYWLLCGRDGTFIRANDELCMTPKCGINCKKYCFQGEVLHDIQHRLDKTKKIFQKASAVIFPSNFIRELFARNNYTTEKAYIIPHGFTQIPVYIQNGVKKKNNAFRIATLAKVTPHKGIDFLISSFLQVPFKDIELHIYGELYKKEELETNPVLQNFQSRLYDLKEKSDAIFFHDKYKQKDLDSLLDNIDVVVQPSVWYEVFGYVCIDALIRGIPIIAPNFTGSSELVTHKENGYVYEFKNQESLTSSIVNAYKDNLKQNSNISYPITVEEEAFQTYTVYKNVLK